MLETALVLSILLVLAFIGLVPAPWAFPVGIVLLVAGLAVGIPTSTVYHWRLHALLAPRGVLGRGWVWNPTRHHRELVDERERVWVLTPFFVAGLAFMACIGGLVIVVAALLRAGGVP
jgi:hypothetical protein